LRVFGSIVLVAILAAVAAAAWIWYGVARPYQGFPSEGVFVTLPHGASNPTVARLLKQNGVIRSALAFKIYARQHRKRKLQAGDYFFNHAMNGQEVFWKIANGEVYRQPFTVREGQTMFDIARALEAGKFMSASAFLEVAHDPRLIQDLAPQAKSLEGFLYPATYFLPLHPTPAELTAEMVKKFREEWVRIAASEMAQDESAPEHQRSIMSVVTLASLVERETPKAEERPLVASVFQNRLDRRIPLQCDPTVIYALEQTAHYAGTLTGKDLHVDSPYNTYAHLGLPPGPIGNPGEASLRAALTPAHTNYLYFVANAQGGHCFAPTLEEHNRNVQRYRRLVAGLPEDPPPPAKNSNPRGGHHRHHGTFRQTRHKIKGTGV